MVNAYTDVGMGIKSTQYYKILQKELAAQRKIEKKMLKANQMQGNYFSPMKKQFMTAEKRISKLEKSTGRIHSIEKSLDFSFHHFNKSIIQSTESVSKVL